jgi:hypothetical protein
LRTARINVRRVGGMNLPQNRGGMDYEE